MTIYDTETLEKKKNISYFLFPITRIWHFIGRELFIENHIVIYLIPI